MSKFDSDKVMPRYFAIAVVLTLVGVAVIVKAGYIMTAEKDYWTEVASRLKRDSVSVKPNRGNILSCDGQLMASSIPEFKIFMDFQAGGEEKDSVWRDSIDQICEGLHRIFPEKSAKEFKRHLERGHKKMARHWPVWPRRIDYGTYTEVKKAARVQHVEVQGRLPRRGIQLAAAPIRLAREPHRGRPLRLERHGPLRAGAVV